jgi:hypothetical protein
MKPIRQRGVYDSAPGHQEVCPRVEEIPTTREARSAVATEKGVPKTKQERVTFYAPAEAVEYLDDVLYLASKRGKEMKIRDRTQIVRALVEAFRRSGHGLGNCLTEDELVEALTARFSR